MQVALVKPESVNMYEARKAFADYAALEKAGRSTAADQVAQEVYRQVLRGRTLLSLNASMRIAGVDPHGRPKLAIARADANWCFFRRVAGWKRNKDGSGLSVSEFRGATHQHARSIAWSKRQQGRGQSVIVPQDLFPISLKDDLRARVPSIPPALRPRADLSRYHILWEADWEAVPHDPFLLRRISTDWYVVLAQWDLTEVERSILAAASYAETY